MGCVCGHVLNIWMCLCNQGVKKDDQASYELVLKKLLAKELEIVIEDRVAYHARTVKVTHTHMYMYVYIHIYTYIYIYIYIYMYACVCVCIMCLYIWYT